jgi:citrate lyase subunit beta / citryl-CoA lyase
MRLHAGNGIMRYRSWLIVPGDSERKLGRALATGADVVVVDLDATVPFDNKQAARSLAADWLKMHRHHVLEQSPVARWVRINALDSRQWREDLIAILPGAPEGIILPRAAGPETVRELAAELYELEQNNQLPAGSIKILPLAGETARSALTIASYAEAAMPRLAGLGWGPDSLGIALGATRSREARGSWTEAFRFVRAQTLLAAHACGGMALEALHDDAEDVKGLKLASKAARADGFTGMFANHPAQIAEINAAFTPSEAEFEAAREIVNAFESAGDGESSPIDRRRVDMPKLKHARQLLGFGEARNGDLSPMRVLRPA